MRLLQTASGTAWSWACLSNWLLDVIVSKLKWTVCLQSSQSLRDGHQSSSSIIPGLDHTMHQQSWAGLNESKSHCAAHNKQLLASELQGCGSIANTANLMYTRSVQERIFFFLDLLKINLYPGNVDQSQSQKICQGIFLLSKRTRLLPQSLIYFWHLYLQQSLINKGSVCYHLGLARMSQYDN